jgi:TPR repeat protein
LLAPLLVGAPARADFKAGEAAYKAGNYSDAYLQLLPAGRAGNPQAQFLLGQLSDNGFGSVALDPREAARWYRMAADQNHGEAQFTLARAYAFGRGVKQDKDQALHWLKKAAENNFEQALIDLARLYDEGRVIEKDPVRAAQLVERAAALGNPDGEYAFAERLAAGNGVTQDRKRAWEWFKRAADNGQPAALYRMGQIIFARHRTIEDNITAYTWLTLATRLGSDEVKKDAARDRDELAKDMTPGDIAQAMTRVRNWKPKPRPTVAQGS